MGAKDVLGNNDIDDVRWLCSLTDAELDLLTGLKKLVKMRADKIGHSALTKKFDLCMLRTFSFIFIDHLKGQLQDLPVASDFECGLSNQNPRGSFAKMTVEDLYPFICSDRRKRMTERFLEEMPLIAQRMASESIRVKGAKQRGKPRHREAWMHGAVPWMYGVGGDLSNYFS